MVSLQLALSAARMDLPLDISEDDRRELERRAQAYGMTLGEYIAKLIRHELDKPDEKGETGAGGESSKLSTSESGT
jgi:hypothetical protein